MGIKLPVHRARWGSLRLQHEGAAAKPLAGRSRPPPEPPSPPAGWSLGGQEAARSGHGAPQQPQYAQGDAGPAPGVAYYHHDSMRVDLRVALHRQCSLPRWHRPSPAANLNEHALASAGGVSMCPDAPSPRTGTESHSQHACTRLRVRLPPMPAGASSYAPRPPASAGRQTPMLAYCCVVESLPGI